MTELDRFNLSLLQDIEMLQAENPDGAASEQVFTEYMLSLLSDSGATEGAVALYDEMETVYNRIPNRQIEGHKINGYAISDNYETVDLFVSDFSLEDTVAKISQERVYDLCKLVTSFFRKAIYHELDGSIEVSSEIYGFANMLSTYNELRDKLVRVHVFVLTNREYSNKPYPPCTISGYPIDYEICDIKKIQDLTEHSHASISIDFKKEGWIVPCLVPQISNDQFQAYLAIIPAKCLVRLYETYGSRLLEQNVRSFLQFSGKINKGLQETIRSDKESPMFLAYNNGLSVTADEVVVEDGVITYINNLQIVNGGQTTASLYYTWRDHSPNLENIYVQCKISQIKDSERYAEIVSNISKYSNTQNKVNDADFSANNEILVKIEQVSKTIRTPRIIDRQPSYWFFERVRGQFKSQKRKDAPTKASEKIFYQNYPLQQVLTKVEIAKYINAYMEIRSEKKILIGPHFVAKGNEKNYSRFINHNLPKAKEVTQQYFVNLVAKAILYRSLEKIYSGDKKTGVEKIGALRNVAVPYTIALFGYLTKYRLDLNKIWNCQAISAELSCFFREMMIQVEDFIKRNSNTSNYTEFGKKEECWEIVRNHKWSFDFSSIETDLSNKQSMLEFESAEEEGVYNERIVNSISSSTWRRIASWGSETGILIPQYIDAATRIATQLRSHRQLKPLDIRRGISIYETLLQRNPDFLLTINEAEDSEDTISDEAVELTSDDMTYELVKAMVDWDRSHKVLENWKFSIMQQVVSGDRILDDKLKNGFLLNYRVLVARGFTYINS